MLGFGMRRVLHCFRQQAMCRSTLMEHRLTWSVPEASFVHTLFHERRGCSSLTDASSVLQAGQHKLFAAKKSRHDRLGGAIATRLRQEGRVSVVAMGPNASYVALRSCVFAGDFLRRDQPDKEVAFSVERHARCSDPLMKDGQDAGGSQYEIHFHIIIMPREESSAELTHNDSTHTLPSRLGADKRQGEDVDVLFSNSINVGKVASFIAKLMAEEGGRPMLRAMGAVSVSQALKAVIIAKTYMTEGPGALCHGEELVLVPQLLRTAVDGSRKMEILLRCRRTLVL